jgi:negative regulator of sigma E activity
MNEIKKGILIVSVSTLCALSAWAEDPRPNPVVILRRTTTAPMIPYEGVVTVGIRQGRDTRMEEVKVRFKPPNHYRWEYMNPDGKIQRAVVTHKEPGLQLAKQEWNLLLANYSVEVTGVDNVLGRHVWQLELTPRVAGKCHRRLLVDQQTGIILENRKFHPNKKEAVMSRFIRFQAPASFSDSLFEEDSHAMPKGIYERIPSAQQRPYPETLPNGFQLVGASAMQVGDNIITQMRYSDGLSIISVFQTVRPVNATAPETPTPAINHVVSQRTRDGHVTLIGDMPDELLKEMALAFNR